MYNNEYNTKRGDFVHKIKNNSITNRTITMFCLQFNM